ncbi:hypothetical protein [Janthinobacterium sp. RB2R34]|uniref:hypothetical protein n=1 Tax=Janthinobacterium sp. RB2R34 TaxID=3424193 RepID=UPI003F23F7AF
MHHFYRAKLQIAAVVLAMASSLACAETGPELENGLTSALHLKKGGSERVGTSGKAIQAYARAGYIDARPDLRADYTDYYLLKKPAPFMGHELVMIEEEYMLRYIGCCVSPGAGLSVKVNGSIRALEAFAHAHRCSLIDNADMQGELASLGIRRKLAPGRYATLSCRERDAERERD